MDDSNADSNSFTSTIIEQQLPTIVEGQTTLTIQKQHSSKDKSNTSAQSNRSECTSTSDCDGIDTTLDTSNVNNTIFSDTCNLATFLIQRACRNPTLSNYLYWYLCIECESQDTVRQQDENVKNMYEKVLRTFKKILQTTSELRSIRLNLEKQQLFIDELVKLVKFVAKESGNRKKKCEKFQQLLADNDAFKINFSSFEPIPLPLDPDVYIRGIIPTKVSLFKSALMPCKYVLKKPKWSFVKKFGFINFFFHFILSIIAGYRL